MVSVLGISVVVITDPRSAVPRNRPGPVRWLLYAVGRPLPEGHREWVRRDVTGPGADRKSTRLNSSHPV